MKEFNQKTRTSGINVFAHSCSSMRSVRMTNNESGASSAAAVVSGVTGTEDMVCFLQGGAVYCMAIGGGCQARLAGGADQEIQSFKIFSGAFNRIWMLAVLSVPVRAAAADVPSKSSGMVFDSLMVRHWMDWDAYSRRNHLLLVQLAVTPEGLLAAREDRPLVDIMRGLETDCPGELNLHPM